MNLTDVIDKIIVRSDRSEQEIDIEDALVSEDQIEFIFSGDYRSYDNVVEIEEREILINESETKLWFEARLQINEIDLDSKTAVLDAKTVFDHAELTDLNVLDTRGLSMETIVDFIHDDFSSCTLIMLKNFEYEIVFK